MIKMAAANCGYINVSPDANEVKPQRLSNENMLNLTLTLQKPEGFRAKASRMKLYSVTANP